MNFTPKNADIFYCESCDFKCSKKSDWLRHISTSKHKNRTILNDFEPYFTPQFVCNSCNRKYSARNSLWYHKKKCENALPEKHDFQDKTTLTDKDQLIKYLIKENSEFKDLIIEQNKMVMRMCDKGAATISNSNINSNNKTFNLNLFLNEHCKDAMNIMDFVDSLKLQLSDLESIGKLGFVNGISNIIVKNLNSLDETKRPIHCTDTKREVIYIKDENKWEKDNESNNRTL